MALNVSLFPSVTVTVPDLRIGWSFRQLCQALGPPRPYVSKEAAPLYSPAEWLPGHERGKLGVAAVHFGVLDLDHWLPDAIVELIASLVARGLAYFLASTWSHGEKGPNDCCARLIVPFSRPVLSSEWPRFWSAMNADVVGGRADPKCKDIGRGYYFPTYRDGNEPPFHDENVTGAPLDVDTLLSRVGGAATAAFDETPEGSGGGFELNENKVRAIGNRLLKSPSKNRQALGAAIFRMVKGEAYAREPEATSSMPGFFLLPEGRNDTTFRIVANICEEYPHADATKLASMFARSVEAMGGEPTLEQIEDMARRQQQAQRATHASLIAEAFGRSGRTDPYTVSELQMFADRFDISLAKLQRRWVIQHGRSYYVFCDGRYRLCGDTEVSVACSRLLAPAITANVDTQKITPQGAKLKTPQELVADYGAVAYGCRVDLTAQHPYLDEDLQHMVEAPCPIRVRAKQHPEIGEWLRLISGDKHERLLQWLAVATALNEPCAALYLEGPKGTGKSLLGYGLARIWTRDRPTTFDEALATFNERVAECPLVFADESVPVDERGMIRTDRIREFIQARSRPLKRKYKPNATVEGCARVILAANNLNLLQTKEHLTKEDIEAITERIFYVRVQEAAKDYLNALERAAPGTTATWVQEDKIAEHCLWLAETIHVPRGHRFLVAGESSDLALEMTVSTGLRASVLQWLVGFLLNPEKIRNRPIGSLVRVSSGRLLVNVKAIVEAWDTYVVGDKNPPKPMEISKALSGYSSEITLRLPSPTGATNQKFRNVHLPEVIGWAERTGYADKEQIEVAMQQIEARGTQA